MTIPDDVQKLIDRSGNSFHAKVARWFSSKGWSISISPYYMDQSQQKARELDLVAEKIVPYDDKRRGWYCDIAIRLFIECKYLTSKTVFWFVDKDRRIIEKMICSGGYFRPENMYTTKHHYLSSGSRVAKLFASSGEKPLDSEPFYKALNQSLNGLVSLRAQLARCFHERQHSGQKIALDFPVVVCNSFSELYAADFNAKIPTMAIDANFQLEVQYAFLDRAGSNRDELFLIDIVEFDKLGELDKAVSEDARLAGFLASTTS